jgi:hypothetical protein
MESIQRDEIRPEPCEFCGALPGTLHADGCVNEVCPFCGDCFGCQCGYHFYRHPKTMAIARLGDKLLTLSARAMRWWIARAARGQHPNRLAGEAIDCADYLAKWRRLEVI